MSEAGPSPFTIERVMGAWQRAREYLANDASLASDERAVDLGEDIIATTEADVETVLRRTVRAMVFAGQRVTEADELMKAMQARKARYQRRQDVLRDTMLDLLISLARKSYAAPEGSASVRNVPASVVILDPDVIPDDYVTIKTTRVPDLKAIKEDLDQGVVIEGAVLSNPGHGLTFRRARSVAEPPTTEDQHGA